MPRAPGFCSAPMRAGLEPHSDLHVRSHENPVRLCAPEASQENVEEDQSHGRENPVREPAGGKFEAVGSRA
eukprot:591397-Pyramimonas_sp.AAC.1